MIPFAFLLVGGIMIYSGIKGNNPLTVLKSVLSGDGVPAAGAAAIDIGGTTGNVNPNPGGVPGGIGNTIGNAAGGIGLGGVTPNGITESPSSRVGSSISKGGQISWLGSDTGLGNSIAKSAQVNWLGAYGSNRAAPGQGVDSVSGGGGTF